MALIPTSGINRTDFNDVTGQYHLVSIDNDTGVVTDLGVITQADQIAAFASLEAQVDLTTAAVVLNTTSVDLVTTAVDLTTAAVVSNEAAVALVDAAVDLTTVSTDTISTNLLARNKIDDTSGGRIVVADAEHHVHEGEAFVVSDVVNVSTTTQKWMITTPDTTRFAHIEFEIVSTGEMSVVITEGADRTGSTPLTAINQRRVGTPTASTTVVHRGIVIPSPDTGTDGATTISSVRTGATGQGAKTVEGGRGVEEFILKQDTKYVIAVETFANIYVTLRAEWYEHTDLA